MNKKLTIAAALLAASTAFAFDLWDGAQGAPQVVTGLDNGTETSGYWFAYDDHNDKGASKVVWADGVSAEPLDGGDLSDVIVWCSGVCGTAVLDKGDLTYNPFVGIGFNVLGEAEGGGDLKPVTLLNGVAFALAMLLKLLRNSNLVSVLLMLTFSMQTRLQSSRRLLLVTLLTLHGQISSSRLGTRVT